MATKTLTSPDSRAPDPDDRYPLPTAAAAHPATDGRSSRATPGAESTKASVVHQVAGGTPHRDALAIAHTIAHTSAERTPSPVNLSPGKSHAASDSECAQNGRLRNPGVGRLCLDEFGDSTVSDARNCCDRTYVCKTSVSRQTTASCGHRISEELAEPPRLSLRKCAKIVVAITNACCLMVSDRGGRNPTRS